MRNNKLGKGFWISTISAGIAFSTFVVYGITYITMLVVLSMLLIYTVIGRPMLIKEDIKKPLRVLGKEIKGDEE